MMLQTEEVWSRKGSRGNSAVTPLLVWSDETYRGQEGSCRLKGKPKESLGKKSREVAAVWWSES